MRKKKNNKINRLELADLLKGKTKFQLYTYLEMYGKLSLTKIAKKLNKSKSTVYEHLKVLHEIGLVKIEKRPVPTSPPTKKPKVKENIYSINPEFELIENLIPGLDPKKITNEQIKMVIDIQLFMTKIYINNFKVQKQVFEKLLNILNEDTEKIRDKIVSSNIDDFMDNNQLSGFPMISSYMHISVPQFQFLLEKGKEIFMIEENDEFKALSQKEKPVILMVSSMPIKNYIEFLNQDK